MRGGSRAPVVLMIVGTWVVVLGIVQIAGWLPGVGAPVVGEADAKALSSGDVAGTSPDSLHDVASDAPPVAADPVRPSEPAQPTGSTAAPPPAPTTAAAVVRMPSRVWWKAGSGFQDAVVAATPGGPALPGPWRGSRFCSQDTRPSGLALGSPAAWWYGSEVCGRADGANWWLFVSERSSPALTPFERSLVGRWTHSDEHGTITLELSDDRTGSGSDGSVWQWVADEGGLELRRRLDREPYHAWEVAGHVVAPDGRTYADRLSGDVVGTRVSAAALLAAIPLPGDPSAADGKDLAARVLAALESAKTAAQWNDARDLAVELDRVVPERGPRTELGVEALLRRVADGRASFFRVEVRKDVFARMQRLIAAKAREERAAPKKDDPPGVAAAGSFAAARQWVAKDLSKELIRSVVAENGLTQSEFDDFWKNRANKTARSASYGSGSFVVKPSARLGRAAASDEEWWDRSSASERAAWLTAWFAESGGLFEVIRRDASRNCEGCGGTGVKKSLDPAGLVQSADCSECGGGGVLVSVTYR